MDSYFKILRIWLFLFARIIVILITEYNLTMTGQ